jgi:hypothetical protein
MTSEVEPASDRRRAPRVQPAFDTVCRFSSPGSDEVRVGLVWNISESGVSMLLTDPLPPNAILQGQLTSENGAAGLAIGFQVVHVVPMPSGDYFLGARFTAPLTQEQLRLFVLPMPDTTPNETR